MDHGKTPYIHRHGQQLTTEEIEQNRLLHDGLGTSLCVIQKQWLIHSKFVIK